MITSSQDSLLTHFKRIVPLALLILLGVVALSGLLALCCWAGQQLAQPPDNVVQAVVFAGALLGAGMGALIGAHRWGRVGALVGAFTLGLGGGLAGLLAGTLAQTVVAPLVQVLGRS